MTELDEIRERVERGDVSSRDVYTYLRLIAAVAMEPGSGDIRKQVEDFDRVIQWKVTDGGPCAHLVMRGGTFEAVDGEHPSPDLSIEADGRVTDKVLSGELDAVSAFIVGMVEIKGLLPNREALEAVRERVRRELMDRYGTVYPPGWEDEGSR